MKLTISFHSFNGFLKFPAVMDLEHIIYFNVNSFYLLIGNKTLKLA